MENFLEVFDDMDHAIEDGAPDEVFRDKPPLPLDRFYLHSVTKILLMNCTLIIN